MAPELMARRRTNGLVMVPSPSTRPHRSDAIQFEVILNDALGLAGAVDCDSDGGPSMSAPSSKRLACHVAVLRSILASGTLGPLQRVMETIASELLRSAYSDAVTTSPLGEASGSYAGIEGIPYFEQLRETQEAAALLSSQLEEQRRTVADSLNYLKERARQDAPSADEEEMGRTIARLEAEVGGLRSEREEALRKVDVAEKEKVEALRGMESEVRRWKQDAADARRETRLLKKKAREQEAVRLAFAELRQPALGGRDGVGAGSAGSPVAAMARAVKEENELAEAVAMESQLILLHNARIDEYEAALESTPPSEVGRLRGDLVQELQAMHDEMVKLDSHIRSFESRLPPAGHMEATRAAPAAARPYQEGSSPQPELEVSYDGGVTFSLLRSSAPGKIAAFALPRDATHIRVRPPLAAGPSPPAHSSSPSPKPSQASRETPQNENHPPPGRTAAKGPARGGVERKGQSGDAAPAGPSPEDPLWDGYFARVASWGPTAAALAPTTAVRSRLPRTARRREVDLQSLLHTIEMVFRAKLKAEGGHDGSGADVTDTATEAHGGMNALGTRTSLHVFLYKWLEDKYGVRATVLLVAHGLLTAVDRFSRESAVVRLFGQVLAGKVDDATWRYTMQWRRVAAAAVLESKDGFRAFVAAMYPGMKDDELAGLVTEYAAAAPQPSWLAALDFLTAKLLDKNEPRVKKWTKILKWKDTAHKNAFRRHDFLEIVGKLFPLLSTDEAAAQFDTAARVSGGDRVTVDTLALIASCVDASLVPTSEARPKQQHPSLIPVALPFIPPP